MKTVACDASDALPPRRERFKIAPESFALALICLLDLGTTLFWVSYRDAAEANPLMRFYLQHFGTYAFIGAKGILCLMPLLIVEWARRLRPRFAHGALRVGVIGYLAFYAIGVFQVNRGVAQARIDVAQEAYNEHAEWTPAKLRHRPQITPPKANGTSKSNVPVKVAATGD